MRKAYESPSLRTIGSVQSLTQGSGPQLNKCHGSGDQLLPQVIGLGPLVTTAACTAGHH